MNLIIRNARILNPKDKTDSKGNIYIDDGIIEKIALSEKVITDFEKSNEKYKLAEIIEADGLVAAPGLIDVHVHFRDPGFTYKEDIYTGSRASVKGGFTTVVMMANTKPVNDNVDTYKDIQNKIDLVNRDIPLNILQACAVTKGLKGMEISDMDELCIAGAAGFTDDGIPILDEDILRDAFVKAKELTKPVSLHEEDPKYITNNGVNAGKVASELGIGGSKRDAEISLIKRDIPIAIETGVDLNIQHISTKEGVELVREARRLNKNIHAEATPHHFSLTEDAVLVHGTLAKMNPPLRLLEDRMAIIGALKDGTIEIIATDHAPHSADEKSKTITEAPSGIIGLETSLALGVTNLVKTGYLTLSELIERMTVGPAKLYGLDKGDISEGKAADIVIFDLDEKWVAGDYESKSKNSPFTGMELTGRVHFTICGGKVSYRL